MALEHNRLIFPPYQQFAAAIASLALPFSPSEIHGLMCGYLCVGASHACESWLRALVGSNKSESGRMALLAVFELFSLSQQALDSFDFSFNLLLPDEDCVLLERAEAFREWCQGFNQGIDASEISFDYLEDEDCQEALRHLQEFAELDIEDLEISEEDEKALMEVTEYARMAVLRLHQDLANNHKLQQDDDQSH